MPASGDGQQTIGGGPVLLGRQNLLRHTRRARRVGTLRTIVGRAARQVGAHDFWPIRQPVRRALRHLAPAFRHLDAVPHDRRCRMLRARGRHRAPDGRGRP